MTTLPTLLQLYNGIITDLETQYGVNISPVGKSVLRAIAAVQAGKLKLYYLVLGKVQKNIFVDTADPEAIGGTLERFGRVKLNRNPFPAVAGQYVIQVTGDIGAVIKASTVFKSDDTALNPAMLFVLDEEYILVATTDTITVRALTLGESSKLNVDDTLTSAAPIAFVDSGALVISESVQPLDGENVESAYRQAIINSYRLEAQGGSATDYRLWSQDAQGVRYVYPYATSGASSEVNLFVEATEADSIDGHGTPSAGILSAVEAVVEMNPDLSLPILERGRRPLQVIVHYIPATPKAINIYIAGAVGFTAPIQAALLIALTDAVNAIRPFVSAADVLANKNDILDVNKIIGVIITSYPGAVFGTVTFDVDLVSLLTYTFIDGNIGYLNSVNYI